MIMSRAQSACRAQNNVRSTMKGQNAFSVEPVLVPAHQSGEIQTGWDQHQLSMRTASSSIVAIRVPPSVCRFLGDVMGCGVAVLSLIVRMHAHAISPLPT